jgi:hypothetical protein
VLEAVELFVPQEVAGIAVAVLVVVPVAHHRCRDRPVRPRHLPSPAAVASRVGRRISDRPMAMCQHLVFDPAQESAAGQAARESPIGRAAFDQAPAFAHRPAFVRVGAHFPPAA